MSVKPVFKITYWGATGTMATSLKPTEVTEKLVDAIHLLLETGELAELKPGPDSRALISRCVHEHLPFHMRSSYGGNTTCLEVQTPDTIIIIDCGSGFRELGIDLARRWNKAGPQAQRVAHILVSHAHMDHTFGTPYFDPYYDPRNNLTLYGSATVLRSMDAVLKSGEPLAGMYFPPTYDMMRGWKERRQIDAGMTLQLGSTTITTYALNHPGGSLAFKLENAGKVFVCATDHEHVECPDTKLADFIRGADLLYTDCQYLADEYAGKIGIMGEPAFPRKGWGHSSVEACVSTAVASGIREIHIGHREPKRNDADMDRVERYAVQKMQEMLEEAGRPTGSCRLRIPYEGLCVEL